MFSQHSLPGSESGMEAFLAKGGSFLLDLDGILLLIYIITFWVCLTSVLTVSCSHKLNCLIVDWLTFFLMEKVSWSQYNWTKLC